MSFTYDTKRLAERLSKRPAETLPGKTPRKTLRNTRAAQPDERYERYDMNDTNNINNTTWTVSYVNIS